MHNKVIKLNAHFFLKKRAKKHIFIYALIFKIRFKAATHICTLVQCVQCFLGFYVLTFVYECCSCCELLLLFFVGMYSLSFLHKNGFVSEKQLLLEAHVWFSHVSVSANKDIP